MMSLRPTKRRNILALLKDDVQREDPSRTVARAMRAIAGAIYYDGELDEVRKFMHKLNLTILPPKSRTTRA